MNPDKQAHYSRNRAGNRLQALLSQKHTIKQDHQSWLVVYLDIITLLLAMFILLVMQPQQEFIVNDPVIQTDKLQSQPIEAEIVTLPEPLDDQLADAQTPSPAKQSNVAEQIQKQLEMIEGDNLVVQVEPGQINLQLPEAILFETGQSELLPAAEGLLTQLIPILQQTPYPVSVEGHTDNVPIFSQQFPSNWELSSARASVVIRKLGELGVTFSRLKAIGYADTQPIESNATQEGRRKNRRVNIIIHAGADIP